MTDPAPPPAHRVALAWSDELGEAPSEEGSLWAARAADAHRLLELSGVLLWREVRLLPVEESAAQFNTLKGFHDPTYLLTLRALSEGTANLPFDSYGLGGVGVTPYRGMAAQATRAVASAISAVRAASGELSYALSLAASQPHARPAEAVSGHLLNDVVLAVRAARLKHGRVALVSLEAEYLPAVQQAFAGDSDVLTAFLHEGTAFLYPGGSVPSGAVSVALPPGAGDTHYLAALERVVAPGLAQQQPAMIVLVGGASAHPSEPLSHLRLTTRGYLQIIERLMALAPRLVVLAGDGSLPTTSARFATLALAALAKRLDSLPPTIPALLARAWGESTLHDPPLRRLSKTMAAYVEERVEEAILRAQRQSFPLWGLPLPSEAAALEMPTERVPPPPPSPSLPERNERLQAIRQARAASPLPDSPPAEEAPARGHRALRLPTSAPPPRRRARKGKR